MTTETVKVGAKVECKITGRKGKITQVSDASFVVLFNGIGLRNVPHDKAEERIKFLTCAPKAARRLRTPVILAPAIEGAMPSFIDYLQNVSYRLYLSCTPEMRATGEDEYLTWTGGEELPNDCVREYDNAYGREWLLIFPYSSAVEYPFPIIERGTGGGQGTAVGLHSAGRIEMCYWQVTEQLIRGGLRAQESAQ